MKAILVMEMPESCTECLCSVKGNYGMTRCRVNDESLLPEEIETYKQNQCPLILMPEKKMELKKQDYYMGEVTQTVYIPVPENRGWNACLDAIEGSRG